ncbi:decorin [Amia ocellicauda]|uniref:decorin n=1 Tax=Amia ocellicauda TaxID=2972642 RepID=UPI003464BBD6|nr:SLIT protein [Amia calva]
MLGRHCALLLILSASHTNTGCPAGCCCPSPGSAVFCEDLALRRLPRSFPLNLSVLSLARNQLCDVDRAFLPFPRLQELSLSHNQLSYFPRGLPSSLEALLLQANRISYLTANSLRKLGNLTRLDLEDNRISVIQVGAFRMLRKLQILSLKDNRLATIPDSLPASLIQLNLANNCISTMGRKALSGLVNLQVLKINNNCLTKIPDRTFENLSRLRTVELADNSWWCECDILYLYRWLLNSRLKIAAHLMCALPIHLERRPLLTLSVVDMCPSALESNDRVLLNTTVLYNTSQKDHTGEEASLGHSRVSTDTSKPLESSANVTNDHSEVASYSNQTPTPETSSRRYTLDRMNHADCQALTTSTNVPSEAPAITTAKLIPQRLPLCSEDVTNSYHVENVTNLELNGPVFLTMKTSEDQPPTHPGPFSQQAVTAVLAVLCVLVLLVLLTVLALLKQALRRNQRVAPAEQP